MNLFDYQERAARLLKTDADYQRRATELRYLMTQPTWNDPLVFRRCATLLAAMHVQTRKGDDANADAR